MQPINLYTLNKTALAAKYLQATGKPATPQHTRQQLIDAIKAAISNGDILSVVDAINTVQTANIKPTVQLVKLDEDNNITDEITISQAVWHNMPASLKEQWQLKTPPETLIPYPFSLKGEGPGGERSED